VELILAKRERYLAALVDVQQILLGSDDQEIHYDQILSLLGDTAEARRAYIFENYWDANDCLMSRRAAVWFANHDETEQVAPLLAEINFNSTLTRWATMLDQEQPVTGIAANLPDDEQELLKAQNVSAILMLPITVNGEFFGFIGFDTDEDGRAWEWGEVDLLYAAAAAISMWQERRYAEEQLREYTVKLQAHNEELDAFAHTVAHDLKNPLSALTGIAEVLAAEYADEELSEYLRVIVRSGRKANNIVKELLLLASVRKQEEVALTPLNMDKIVAETWERLLHLLKQHHAEFIVPTTWPTALGYAPWIEEVWANYMSNGLKYGGEPPRLELGAEEQAGGQIRFWIRDNGPGLQPEEQVRLFTPFTKLKQARAKGQGLGLSIVRRIIERLGGTVGVESNPEVEPGSTFYFTLPKADPATDPSAINR
ncbi:MAG: GAF domain-containing sensor histidine kinase, partial [Anaerolineae bacterium]|nr:GAF domain-containing sensor histidine kinase [Anaerolineae bacterium]